MSDKPISEQIEQLLDENKIVLFMKGTSSAPECGFSARAADVLRRCGAAFKDVDVLADQAMRQGLKDYSNWPAIPQAFVDGKLVGGSDILLEMFNSGELQSLLGLGPAAGSDGGPAITIAPNAVKAFAAVGKDAEPGEVLRFEINPSFQHALFFGPKRASDHAVVCGELTLHVSRDSAARADGVNIDSFDGSGSVAQGVGFKIDNPNQPAGVSHIGPAELETRLKASEPVVLIDVRGPKERQRAGLEQALALDAKGQAMLADLPKDALVVFFCHHGMRSVATPTCTI